MEGGINSYLASTLLKNIHIKPMARTYKIVVVINNGPNPYATCTRPER
jgi:hypothetical protein